MGRAATELRGRNHEDERWTRDGRKAERLRSCRNEYLRRHDAAFIVLMVRERSRAQWSPSVMPGEMRVHRLTLMVRGVLRVEMQVRQRSGNCSGLHEHDEHGGRQPAKHAAIVVNRAEAGT